MSPTEIDVAVWSRENARAWRRDRYRALNDTIPLPALGVSLPLAVLYDGIELRSEFPKAVPG